jgi:putative toxin-antitoxin system antitoxin component (TIGR02293 family)
MAESATAALLEPGAASALDVAAYWRAAREPNASPHRYLLLLGLEPKDPLRIAEQVGRGLRFRAFERFRANAGLTSDQLSELVAVTPRTRQRRKETGRLEPTESDRLVRAARTFGQALELFEGDADAAHRWFTTKATALGDRSPIVLCRSDVGTREVEALIGRLEHGVLS